jgi:hypothetical protein
MEERFPAIVVNLHTIIGGVIGVISMFLPWVVKDGSDRYSLIEILSGNFQLVFSLGILLPLIGIIFVLGTSIVFVSPYGAAAQIGGASMALFLVGIASSASAGDHSVAIGLGPYLGLVSSAVVFISIVFPFGVGFGHWRPLGNRGRNYTLSFYRDVSDSDGIPIWWWVRGPGVFWYWWFEKRVGWAFRDAYARRQGTKTERALERTAGEEDGSQSAAGRTEARIRDRN